MGGEEGGADPADGGFLGDGLRPVLTELEPGALADRRFGPGAARAVEAGRLVDP
jgi:hypothetical protein